MSSCKASQAASGPPSVVAAVHEPQAGLTTQSAISAHSVSQQWRLSVWSHYSQHTPGCASRRSTVHNRTICMTKREVLILGRNGDAPEC